VEHLASKLTVTGEQPLTGVVALKQETGLELIVICFVIELAPPFIVRVTLYVPAGKMTVGVHEIEVEGTALDPNDHEQSVAPVDVFVN